MSRRGKGITTVMHQAIKHSKREQYENHTIHNLLAKFNPHRTDTPHHHETVDKASAKVKSSNPEEFPHLVNLIKTRSSLLQEKSQNQMKDLKLSGKISSTDYSTNASE